MHPAAAAHRCSEIHIFAHRLPWRNCSYDRCMLENMMLELGDEEQAESFLH
jgi:hypothetical protein